MRANKRRGSELATVPVAQDELDEFGDMTVQELRFHKYAELKEQWEQENSRIVPNSLSYLLQEQARQWADRHSTDRQKKVRSN